MVKVIVLRVRNGIVSVASCLRGGCTPACSKTKGDQKSILPVLHQSGYGRKSETSSWRPPDNFSVTCHYCPDNETQAPGQGEEKMPSSSLEALSCARRKKSGGRQAGLSGLTMEPIPALDCGPLKRSPQEGARKKMLKSKEIACRPKRKVFLIGNGCNTSERRT